MELSLIRSLMNRSFYDDHRGAKCPDKLFSKDVRKIKQTIDSAMTCQGASDEKVRILDSAVHILLKWDS